MARMLVGAKWLFPYVIWQNLSGVVYFSFMILFIWTPLAEQLNTQRKYPQVKYPSVPEGFYSYSARNVWLMITMEIPYLSSSLVLRSYVSSIITGLSKQWGSHGSAIKFRDMLDCVFLAAIAIQAAAALCGVRDGQKILSL